jgi:hypothetical protein
MAGLCDMKARHRSLRRAAMGTLLILAMGSCATQPAPQPAPPAPPRAVLPPPAPAAPPVVVGSWDELPVTEGAWSYDNAQRRARFVDDSGLERAALTCSAPGRAMQLALAGGGGGTLDVLTSAGASQHALTGGAADLPVGDIALDRMAFSRGRFALRAGGLLVLPVQAEIGRVIEDCRG